MRLPQTNASPPGRMCSNTPNAGSQISSNTGCKPQMLKAVMVGNKRMIPSEIIQLNSLAPFQEARRSI